MSFLDSRRISLMLAAISSPLAISLPPNPAWARAIPLNLQGFDINQLLSDPLNLAIGGALVLAFAIGTFVVLRKSPNLADAQRAKEEYLSALPGNAQGYTAVFYEDKVQGLYMGAGDLYNHRILIELTHENPAKSKTLFRNQETPSLSRAMHRQESAHAMKLWIREARDKELPAVYTTQRSIHALEEGHFAEMSEDSASFIKKFQSQIQKRKPLPAP